MRSWFRIRRTQEILQADCIDMREDHLPIGQDAADSAGPDFRAASERGTQPTGRCHSGTEPATGGCTLQSRYETSPSYADLPQIAT